MLSIAFLRSAAGRIWRVLVPKMKSKAPLQRAGGCRRSGATYSTEVLGKRYCAALIAVGEMSNAVVRKPPGADLLGILAEAAGDYQRGLARGFERMRAPEIEQVRIGRAIVPGAFGLAVELFEPAGGIALLCIFPGEVAGAYAVISHGNILSQCDRKQESQEERR
jgi:hypothetical protein